MIINPIIGPEPIAGSSRMKGGSATKILLDAIILIAAQQQQQTNTSMPKEHLTVSQIVTIYAKLLKTIQVRQTLIDV